MTILDVLLVILIIVAIIVGIYLIFALRKINNTLDIVREDINILNNRLEPILENLTIITEKFAKISEETERRIFDISNTIQNVRNTVSKLSFRNENYAGRNPVQDLLNNVSAISKGVSAFWRKLYN
ncbi:MAG: hypothetical protein IPH62_13715 [Ignavibacteriae bacterium]|nr:hypothetical protein [Ignavibacteriota bacterium]